MCLTVCRLPSAGHILGTGTGTGKKILKYRIGNVTGNPGVFRGNPHPYPWKPAPVATGTGFYGYGCGFYKTHGCPRTPAGYPIIYYIQYVNYVLLNK
jgi:hypothetical protein